MSKCCDGPVSALLRLLCHSRCRGKLVAAALSFHPPAPPYYSLSQDPSEAAVGTRNSSTSTTSTTSITSITPKESHRISPHHTPTPTYPTGHPSYHRHLPLNTRLQLRLSTECGPIGTCQPDAYLIRCLQQKNKHLAITVYKQPQPSFVLLYSHGNATDLGAMHHVLVQLSVLCNLTVVCYDYSGYGMSSGTPSEAATYDTIQTVYNFLLQERLVSSPATELLCYGESIGSGPAVWLCSRIKCAGLILHCPIASGLRVVTENRLLCCCDIFPNLNRIGNIQCSTFVIHGEFCCCCCCGGVVVGATMLLLVVLFLPFFFIYFLNKEMTQRIQTFSVLFYVYLCMCV